MNHLDVLLFQKRAYLSHLTGLMLIEERGIKHLYIGFEFDDEFKRTERMIADVDVLIKREESNAD